MLRDLAGAQLRRVMPWFEVGEVQRLLEPMGVRYDENARASWARAFDFAGLPWPRRAQAFDLMTFCAGSILPKIDRASMAVGLEVRSPFLDRRLLEWALRLPTSDAGDACRSARAGADNGEQIGPRAGTNSPTKVVLREYLRDRVPRGVLMRPKQGFSLRMRPGLWDAAIERLGESRLVKDGLLHEHWRAMVAPDQPHAPGKRQALTMLAAWWEARA